MQRPCSDSPVSEVFLPAAAAASSSSSSTDLPEAVPSSSISQVQPFRLLTADERPIPSSATFQRPLPLSPRAAPQLLAILDDERDSCRAWKPLPGPIRPVGSLGLKCSQHSQTTRPSVERTAEKAYWLSDRVARAEFQPGEEVVSHFSFRFTPPWVKITRSALFCQTVPILDSVFSARCPRITTRGPLPVDFSKNGVAGARASDGQ